MTGALWGLLAAIVASGAFTAVFAPGYVRRQVASQTEAQRADAASTISHTALDLVQPLRDEMRELRGEAKVYQERVRSLERQEREHAQVLSLHAAWDMAVAQAARAAGIDIGPMPGLFPPRRAERTRATDG